MNLKKYIGDRAFYERLMVILIPILIQNVITNLVNLLDNLMVGQIGTEPMSGVAIVNQLIFVFNLSIFGGLAAPGIFAAQYFGKRDTEGVRNTFRAKLYITIVILAVFCTAILTFRDTLIGLFLHKGNAGLSVENTLNYAKSYLSVVILQVPLFGIQQVYASTLRDTGETILPMKAGVISVFVNLIGNWILIFGKLGAPALGVTGAALATVIARVVELMITVIWTHKHISRNEWIHGVYSSFYVPSELLKKIIILGSPLFLNEILWSTGMTTLTQCYSTLGIEVVSAVNIAQAIINLFMCEIFAVGNAVSIMVGQLLGAGELERAEREDTQIIAFSVTFTAVIALIMILLAPQIPNLYNTIEEVKHIASAMLIIKGFMLPFDAYINGTYFTLRSGGKTIITFIFDSVFVWCLLVPTAFILTHFTELPIVPIYAIISCFEIVKAFIGYYFLKRKDWLNNLVSDI